MSRSPMVSCISNVLLLFGRMSRSPMVSCISNVLLLFRRKSEIKCSSSLPIGGIILKCVIIKFQEARLLGKKLFMYLDDIHLISRRVLLISALNKYGLLFGGNLSVRYEEVMLFIIL